MFRFTIAAILVAIPLLMSLLDVISTRDVRAAMAPFCVTLFAAAVILVWNLSQYGTGYEIEREALLYAMPLIGVVAFGARVFFYYRRKRRILTLNWPENLSDAAQRKYLLFYLKCKGFHIQWISGRLYVDFLAKRSGKRFFVKSCVRPITEVSILDLKDFNRQFNPQRLIVVAVTKTQTPDHILAKLDDEASSRISILFYKNLADVV